MRIPALKTILKRTALTLMLAPLVLAVLLLVSLYVPVVQNWVCQGVLSALNASEGDWTYEIGKVRLRFPLLLQVDDLVIRDRQSGEPLVRVGGIATGLDDIPRQQSGIILNRLHLEDVDVRMDSLTEGFGVKGSLHELDVKRIELDLDASRIALQEAVIDHPDVSLYIGPSSPDTTETSAPWTVALGRIALRDGKLSLDMSERNLSDAQHYKDTVDYLDYNHLRLTGLNLVAEQIGYTADGIVATARMLLARDENSGMEVTDLSADFEMKGDHIEVRELDLNVAAGDYVRGNLALDLTVLDSIPQGIADVKLKAAIDSVNLVRIVTPYMPALAQGWVTNQQSYLEVEAYVNADNLDVRHLALSIPDHVELNADGHGSMIFDHQNRTATAKVNSRITRVDPLLTLLVADSADRSFRVPDSLELHLDARQQGQRLTATLALLQQDQKVVNANATYNVDTEEYQVDAQTHGLNVSDYVPAIVADRMAMHVQAEGRHFDPAKLSTRMEAKMEVDTLYYRGEDGRRDSLLNIAAVASLTGGNYEARIESGHPTLRLVTQVEGCYRKDSVSIAGKLDIWRADMGHLPYLRADSEAGILSIRSRFDIGYNWADNARMRIAIDTLAYDEKTFHQHFSDIMVCLDSHKDWLTADITGGDAILGLSTDRSVAQWPAIVDSLLTEFNRQSKAYRPDVDALIGRLPRLDVQLNMARNNPFIQALERQTGISFDKASLTLINDRYLTLDGAVMNLADGEGSMSFDTITVEMKPAAMSRAYDYGLYAQHDDLREMKAFNVRANGRLMPDSLTAGVTYVNAKQKTVYDVLASLALGDDTLRLHLEQGPTLYEQPFTVNPDNYISLMKYRDIEHEKPVTKARLMMDGPRNMKVNLYTRKMPDREIGNQLLLLVRNLDLDYASRLMEWDGNMRGTLNMTSSVDIFPDSVNARLRTGIKHFGMGDYTSDTLALVVTAQAAPNRRDLNGIVKLDSIEKVHVEATLADSTDIRAHVDELPLPMLGSLLPQNMKLTGTASGDLKIQGPDMDHVTINGGLAMSEAGMNYTDLNAKLRFPNDTIRFGRNRLLIRNYKILAANGNPINIRGLVDFSKDMSNPAISLTMTGENVRLIDNKKLELPDQYIYGRLPVNSDIKVSGTASNLNVTGRLEVLSGTNLQFFMQDDPLESSSKVDQMVEFVRFSQIDRMISANRGRNRRQVVQTSTDEGLNINLKIDLARDANVTAHLAGTDNNKVEIEGGAALNMRCGTDGLIVMNGTYELNGGKVNYKLPILPMVKTFGISNSSTLVWQDSDPGNPTINITATEEVKSTVNDEAGSRVVKFLVSININGTLDALNMTFDCSAPEDGAISQDIASLDAEERSKAALMLLIAQTYIGPGNSSSMGLGTANAALNSMLNREMDSMLAGMKHTSIDLGIDTYNTDAGNTRTNYSVKVSQNFFNDRFRATIGGQVSSGGDVGQSSGARLGDMSLEWLIKRDGSHLMKIFRKTNYESVLEGELIETGISYVQERSAYRLKQLFIPTSKKRQQRMQQLVKQMQESEAQAERELRRRRREQQTQPRDSGMVITNDSIQQQKPNGKE